MDATSPAISPRIVRQIGNPGQDRNLDLLIRCLTLAITPWTEADLKQRRKGDGVKVRMARLLRAETVMTLEWIARRLQMGTRTHLNHLLYWAKRGEAKPKPT